MAALDRNVFNNQKEIIIILLLFVNVILYLLNQVNGESVEENANLVIRLLIRRPECLGPALRGEGEGLLRAIMDANKVCL